MDYNVIKYETLEEIANITRGIRFSKNDKVNTIGEKYKILDLGTLQLFYFTGNLRTEKLDNIIIDLNKKQKGINSIAQKGDIILPVYPTHEVSSLFLNYDCKEKCIYNELVYIVKVTKNEIDAEYIYYMIHSNFKNFRYSLKQKGRPITNLEELRKFKIPILSEKDTKDFIQKYREIELKNKKLEENYKKKKNEYTAALKKLTKI